MANTAAETARNALAAKTNQPGYCLQYCRTWAGASARYPDAATAWYNTNDRHPKGTNPPRGAMCYWVGGSHGYGHIAVSLGKGPNGTHLVRSTDAGGSGRVATVPLKWFHDHWGLTYAGWAWDVNEQTIRH